MNGRPDVPEFSAKEQRELLRVDAAYRILNEQPREELEGVIATIFALVDGQDVGADFSAEVIEQLESIGLHVDPPDEEEDD